MKTFLLKPGAAITLDGESWLIHSIQTREDGSVIATRKRSDSEEYVTETLEKIFNAYKERRLQGIAFGTDGSTVIEGKVLDPVITEEDKILLHTKKRYINAIINSEGTLVTSRERREKDIKKVFLQGIQAREISGSNTQRRKNPKDGKIRFERYVNYESCPCERTVRNWYKDWIKCGRQDYGLLPNRGQIQVRSIRVDSGLLEKLHVLIDEKCRHREKWCISDLAAAMPELNYATVRRALIKYKDNFQLDLATLGYFRAKNKTPSGFPRLRPDSILVEVESDHHQLDVLVVDLNKKIILGIAIITLIIDVKSGVIFGRYISFRKNTNAVLKAIRHAILPKSDARWVFGRFLNFHCDNADGFLGKGLTPHLVELSIEPTNMRKKHGNDKGRVERGGGAMNQFVCHKLRGTTFSNYRNAEDYKSERFAFITFEELTILIDEYILTIHNQGRDKLTNMHRMVVWNTDPLSKSIQLPTSVQEIEILTMEKTERSIQRDGIELNNILYDFGDLFQLRHRHGIKAKVQVRYDDDELQYIWVKHDQDAEWTQVRAANPAYHVNGYSLVLHNKLRNLALLEGLSVGELLENKNKLNEKIDELNKSNRRRFQAKTSGFSSENPAGKAAPMKTKVEFDMKVFSKVKQDGKK